ncbi:hypothetical protein AN641_00980 [Candidatus Epulonipiscioides gigas]|nr:hypothetical protein AN641_00980 [Epulopiscium sp. SCG-C07WGA-EpuloA2]
MISFKKQMLILFIGLGIFIVILVSIFINNVMNRDFRVYIESNIKLVGQIMASEIAANYDGAYLNVNEVKGEIIAQLELRNYAISILDANKVPILGIDKNTLISEINQDSKVKLDETSLQNMHYVEIELPIFDKLGNIIAFVKIGYFPSLILSNDDLIFQQKVNESIIIVSSITTIISILVAIYLTKIISKPIYQVSKTSASLIKGDYLVRYSKRSNIKEIEILRKSINNLAQRLQEEDELRKKLVSDISHEIRTPLHILQSNLEAMIDGIYPVDEEQMSYLHKEVVRFSKLLKNLDKLKGAEEYKKTLNIKPYKLNEQLEYIFNNFKILAFEKNIQYILDIEKTKDIQVNIDLDAFKQIIMNILSNSFKFTKFGEISLSTCIKTRKVVIIIKDTGIGISEKDIPYIFDRMYRADKSREKYEGSGIGLSIVNSLIFKLDGEISVKSSEGVGTSMIISLPIAK